MLLDQRITDNVTEIRRFEARIYNAKVRSLIDAGDINDTGFDDRWADSRLIEVCAQSLDDALRLFQRDYPSHCGFKITAIIEIAPVRWLAEVWFPGIKMQIEKFL